MPCSIWYVDTRSYFKHRKLMTIVAYRSKILLKVRPGLEFFFANLKKNLHMKLYEYITWHDFAERNPVSAAVPLRTNRAQSSDSLLPPRVRLCHHLNLTYCNFKTVTQFLVSPKLRSDDKLMDSRQLTTASDYKTTNFNL